MPVMMLADNRQVHLCALCEVNGVSHQENVLEIQNAMQNGVSGFAPSLSQVPTKNIIPILVTLASLHTTRLSL